MQKWFQQELKSRGFARFKSRKAYGCKFVNDIEFYIRLNNDVHNKERWYPEFGITIPYSFGVEDGMDRIGMTWYHVYLGEIIERDSSTDIWTEENKEELLETLDTIIVPWIERYSDLNELINHYLERIKNGVPILPHKRYRQDQERVENSDSNDAGAQLLGMLLTNGPAPDTARRFWEYVAIFYNQVGERDKAIEAITNFLDYKKEKSPNPKKGSFPARQVDKIESALRDGVWPNC